MRSMFIASLLMSSLAMSGVAFAAADKGGSPKPVAAPPTTPAPAPVTAPVIGDTPVVPPAPAGDIPAATPAAASDFEVFGITSDIPVPANRPKPGRGGQSVYPFEKLEINQSFGIKGKSSKLIASTVSSANKRNMEDVMQAATNADGTPKLDATTGLQVTEPVMVSQTTKNKDGTTSTAMVKKQRPTKLFVAYPVDPKTDKQGASVRVFRVALPA